MKLSFKSFLPHLVALVLFVVLPSIYFSPLFDGYALKQSDIRQFQGMSKEILNFTITAGDTLVADLHYILGLCLRINPWLAMIGAIGYGFSTINILYLGAGHMSKVNSIAYMAPALGGLLLAFRGRWLLGSAVFALFLGLNITANHLQMTYYLAFILGAVAVAEVLRLLLAKEWKPLGFSIAGLAVASILALLANAGLLFSTQEYSKFTTRGTSELTIKPKDGGSQAKEWAQQRLHFGIQLRQTRIALDLCTKRQGWQRRPHSQ